MPLRLRHILSPIFRHSFGGTTASKKRLRNLLLQLVCARIVACPRIGLIGLLAAQHVAVEGAEHRSPTTVVMAAILMALLEEDSADMRNLFCTFSLVLMGVLHLLADLATLSKCVFALLSLF